MISSKFEFPKQVINFEKIKNFKYLSDDSCRKCLPYNLSGLKLCLLDMEKVRAVYWKYLVFNFGTNFVEINLCATVICNVLLIRQQEKVILFMWINRMLLYLFAQVFLSLSHLMRECTLLHWHWRNTLSQYVVDQTDNSCYVGRMPLMSCLFFINGVCSCLL